ncbi:MAG TPA: methylated-DNA--[protein]-cysteine S-methyltransferase [Gallionellaceae bacterium]|nr:methylated-DNA--[protein]-cysteine S-methyltransferase [Gallionellaceae bacterium]
MDDHARLQTPFGILGISCSNEALTGIAFLAPGTAALAPRTALAQEVRRQLTAYFDDPDFRFDLPLAYEGTPHQRRVWQAMCAIPRGAVRSYGEVAAELASSPLAAGQACGANRLPIVIPCHRIVGKTGIGGFANHRDGYLLDIKRWLLRHEGVL